MTDSTMPDDDTTALPDEPKPDAFGWTAKPEQPDAAGMPGEFVNEPGDGVPGVRRDRGGEGGPAGAFDQESNN